MWFIKKIGEPAEIIKPGSHSFVFMLVMISLDYENLVRLSKYLKGKKSWEKR